MRSDPSEPPATSTTLRSWGRPSSSRARLRESGERSTAATSGRMGFPVTTARGRGVPSNDTALARAKRAVSRLTAPGTAFCSATTKGTRRSTAAAAAGRAA